MAASRIHFSIYIIIIQVCKLAVDRALSYFMRLAFIMICLRFCYIRSRVLT